MSFANGVDGDTGKVQQRKIVLASSSPRRKQLLKKIKLEYEVAVPEVDEEVDVFLEPSEVVKSLSLRKAAFVAERISYDALVIGADTIVTKDKILGKPENKEEAAKMLCLLQDSWHFVYTGITIIDTCSGKELSDYEKTSVKMREMDEQLINAYIRTDEPFDKAGGYGIQGMGALLVEKIEGCYNNVVGLPVIKLGRMLEKFGFNVL